MHFVQIFGNHLDSIEKILGGRSQMIDILFESMLQRGGNNKFGQNPNLLIAKQNSILSGHILIFSNHPPSLPPNWNCKEIAGIEQILLNDICRVHFQQSSFFQKILKIWKTTLTKTELNSLIQLEIIKTYCIAVVALLQQSLS